MCRDENFLCYFFTYFVLKQSTKIQDYVRFTHPTDIQRLKSMNSLRSNSIDFLTPFHLLGGSPPEVDPVLLATITINKHICCLVK